MTMRRDVEQRWRSLGEIREVMNSMKTLAYMETHKLARFLTIQQRQVADIEAMAADLLASYPEVKAMAPPVTGSIMLGAERGFCGDFNERLIHLMPASAGKPVIAVGRRLGTRLDPGGDAIAVVDGASATEQVASVRDALATAVARLQRERGPLALTLVYQESAGAPPRQRELYPPFASLKAARPGGFPPRLNLSPEAMFAALLDQYLFAVLSEALYTSLMAENQKRTQHLDSAIRHLDERRDDLARRSRALRQEEIVEEIEVILLNVEDPGTARYPRRL